MLFSAILSLTEAGLLGPVEQSEFAGQPSKILENLMKNKFLLESENPMSLYAQNPDSSDDQDQGDGYLYDYFLR